MSDGLPSKSEYIVSEMQCPECGYESAKTITHQLDIPFYDDFMMININCEKCDLRVSDFFHTDSRGHIISTYKIDGIEDMTTKVVRASDGIVSIPELGVQIDPVSGASTWVRNVEGILDDIKAKIRIVLRDTDDELLKEQATERIETINKMMNFEIPYTVIVEDINGNSVILPAIESKLKVQNISN